MIIKEYHDLRDVKKEIINFEKENNINVFMRYYWLKKWIEYFGFGLKQRIICFYNEKDKLIGFCPLYYKKNSFLKCKIYRIISYGKSAYLNLPIKDEYIREVCRLLFKYLSKSELSSMFIFQDISEESKDYKILDELLDNYKGVKNLLYYCPFVSLSNEWEIFFKKHFKRSKKRSELLKFKKKLDKIGKVNLIRVNNYNEYIGYKKQIINTFNLHKKRFKDTFNTSEYSNARYRNFYLDIIEKFCYSEDIEISLLCIDNEAISFILAFRQRDILIDCIPAVDPAFKKYSLGHIHLMLLFKKLCTDSKINLFDFSKGKSVYKNKWSNGSLKNYEFIFRFGNNNIIFLLNRFFLTLKIYGRKKGWNKIIKKYYAKIKNMTTYDITPKIYINEIPKEKYFSKNSIHRAYIIKSFRYYLIKDFETKLKKFIVDSIYNSNKIDLVYFNNKLKFIIEKGANDKYYFVEYK